MNYFRPHPWQPSPVIYSFGHAAALDIESATAALNEWIFLAYGAERNIPMLFVNPPSAGPAASITADSNTAIWDFTKKMEVIAKEKHVEVLSLYNLTLQTFTGDGRHFGEKVALVEAMMIINWLSKLETS
jgi:hypothetical protein